MEKNDTGQQPPENEKPGTSLSKSLFIRGRQCHKSLWLQKHRPELKNELTRSQEAVFTLGHKVGNLAKGLFPAGWKFLTRVCPMKTITSRWDYCKLYKLAMVRILKRMSNT